MPWLWRLFGLWYASTSQCPINIVFNLFSNCFIFSNWFVSHCLNEKKSFSYSSQDKVPIEYTAQIDRIKNTWNGTATIPMDYLPPHVGRINAYAIHGSGVNRRYESLYPASADVSNPDLWVKWSHCIVNYTIMHWLVKSSLFIFSTQKNVFTYRWGFNTCLGKLGCWIWKHLEGYEKIDSHRTMKAVRKY